MPSFDDVAGLESWLRTKGIATDLYGKGAAKSLSDLLEECRSGECVLDVDAAGRALRHVTLVSVWLCDARGRVLVEVAQQLPSGQRRERRLPLSEKMLPSEHWRDATLRGIREELGSALPVHAQARVGCLPLAWGGFGSGLTPQHACGKAGCTPMMRFLGPVQIDIEEGSHAVIVESMVSGSYPDLITQFTSHQLRVRVPCLPDHGFSTTERRPDGTLTSTWDWVPAEVLVAK